MKKSGDVLEVSTPSGEVELGKDRLKPMELMLVALGGCTAMDVDSILTKMRYGFSLAVEVRGRRRREHPRVYTDIEILYRIDGDVPERAAQRAVSLSLNRYCSASAMLSNSARISYRVLLNGKEVLKGEKGKVEDQGEGD